MQLMPSELALANFKGEVPVDERGYMERSEAYEWLKELSGKDFGNDVASWEQWVKQDISSVPSKVIQDKDGEL